MRGLSVASCLLFASVSIATQRGALYLMSNEHDANYLLAHTINDDGTVEYARSIYTGGKGSHGLNLPGLTHIDPLYSVDSVFTSGNYLYVANAGSDTVSMFEIDQQDPTRLTMIGQPVGTGGEFPMSLSMSPKTGNLCVLNGGKVNGVLCYTVSPTKGLTPLRGTLRMLNNTNTTPPTGPPFALSHLKFTPDGDKLVVSAKGSLTHNTGYMATWGVNEDGTLSNTWGRSTSPGGFPFQMVSIPNSNALFTADAGYGAAVYDFGGVNQELLTVDNWKSVNVTPNGAICWSVYSQNSGTYFLVDLVTSIATEIQLDETLSPSVKNRYPQTTHSGTIDTSIVNIDGTEYVYMLAANISSIEVMRIPPSGVIENNYQTYAVAPPAKAAGTFTDPNNLQGMAAYIIGIGGSTSFAYNTSQPALGVDVPQNAAQKPTQIQPVQSDTKGPQPQNGGVPPVNSGPGSPAPAAASGSAPAPAASGAAPAPASSGAAPAPAGSGSAPAPAGSGAAPAPGAASPAPQASGAAPAPGAASPAPAPAASGAPPASPAPASSGSAPKGTAPAASGSAPAASGSAPATSGTEPAPVAAGGEPSIPAAETSPSAAPSTGSAPASGSAPAAGAAAPSASSNPAYPDSDASSYPSSD